MADFTSTQAQLAAARAALRRSATGRTAGGSAGADRRRQRWTLRPGRAARRTTRQNLAQLAAAAKQARPSRRCRAEMHCKSARASVGAGDRGISPSSPIRSRMSACSSDSSPFLLFPVRIETRFRDQSPPAAASQRHRRCRRPHASASGCASIPTTARSTPSSRCSRSRSWPTSRAIG